MRMPKSTLQGSRFPNEKPTYRAVRNRLLKAEIDLRRRIEAVAAMRRKLPLGGRVPEDYVFEDATPGRGDDANPERVRLSELFMPGRNTLLVYSYMFGPAMAAPCVMCTSIIDSLDGAADHVNQRASLVVVAKSPAVRIRAFASERSWRHVRLLSSAHNTYNRDYHGEDAGGGQLPSMNVFVRRGGKIRHFYHSELLFAPADRGQNERHVDSVWPLWNLLDLTPEGRGKTWLPALRYD
jgi:predicted dithiol-disulfide oxidoreductase (DUF899 family)